MPIFEQGELNTAALIVPDVYVQIVPPQNLAVQGLPTNIVGMVGSASWGPVNKATIVGDMSGYVRAFGGLRARKHDMATALAVCVQQGANSFRCVRVTDGTDAKATGIGPAGAISFTALHTGTLGNSVTVSVAPGTRVGSFSLVVRASGFAPERFDNVTGTGNAFWVAAARALNEGDGYRAASALVRAAAGADTDLPVLATYTLSGGTDGADGVDSVSVLGTDGAARTGAFALRGTGMRLLLAVDADATATWPALVAFARSESALAVVAGPAGQTIEDAIAVRATLGLDDWNVVALLGDHLYWLDPVAGRLRLVNPSAFYVGRCANLSPHVSPLNKRVFGVVGSQKVGDNGSGESYSRAELEAIGLARLDVVTTPAPGGNYWTVRFGANASSDPRRGSVVYSRMTHFVSTSIERTMGIYEGEPVNAGLMPRVRASLRSFFSEMQGIGMLGDFDGSRPWSVVCDGTNNSVSALGNGLLRADTQVRYAPTVEKFLINLEGGQGVQVSRSE